MKVTLLNHDSHCRWLENKVLKGIYPRVMKNARDPSAKKQYIIVDWISNDNGKVGVDLKWFKTLGVPAVQSYRDLPANEPVSVINTGYDSIVEEEKMLRQQGIDIIDEPCPFIRRLRKYFENHDAAYQYVYLCEESHITMKNFKTIFPVDMILIQMRNYQERLHSMATGKPFMLIPYVTFLPKHVDEIMHYMHNDFPMTDHKNIDAHCLWVKSKASPIVEINEIPDKTISNFNAALLLTGSADGNKSLFSLKETVEDRGIPTHLISSLREYRKFEKQHDDYNVLLVRSPIPNNTEKYIMAYINGGWSSVLKSRFINNRFVKAYSIGFVNRFFYSLNYVKLKIRKIAHYFNPSADKSAGENP